VPDVAMELAIAEQTASAEEVDHEGDDLIE